MNDRYSNKGLVLATTVDDVYAGAAQPRRSCYQRIRGDSKREIGNWICKLSMAIRTYIIVDLEATCDEDMGIDQHEIEIIEIGAIAVDALSLETLGEFQAFVRPIRNPRLTKYCTELTSITQVQVDQAQGFPSVLKSFTNWLSQFDNPYFASWGNFDLVQLKQDCEFHKEDYPFSDDHWNIKSSFANTRPGEDRGIAVSLQDALTIAGLSHIGAPHRALDDARSTAQLLPWLSETQEKFLGDRVIRLSDEQYEKFLKMLERPSTDNPGLKKLLNRPAPWEE